MNSLAYRASLSVVVLLAGCTSDAAAPSNPGGGQEPEGPLAIALGWVGLYDGGGVVTVGEERQEATDLVLRIALDTDSIASASCPACVTVILDPWFAKGNLRIATGSEAALTYELEEVVRSLTINKFSAGGQTANVLTARLRHETVPSAGLPARTLVDGVLEFLKR